MKYNISLVIPNGITNIAKKQAEEIYAGKCNVFNLGNGDVSNPGMGDVSNPGKCHVINPGKGNVSITLLRSKPKKFMMET